MGDLFSTFRRIEEGLSVLVHAVSHIVSIQNNEYAIVVHYRACPWPLQFPPPKFPWKFHTLKVSDCSISMNQSGF